MTTSYGAPVDNKTQTLTIGPRGPVLLQDNVFLDEMAHFDRERIPERVVHAKGAGAFGEFVATHDISQYCKAAPFASLNKKTPVAVRFSTVGKVIAFASLNVCFFSCLLLSFFHCCFSSYFLPWLFA